MRVTCPFCKKTMMVVKPSKTEKCIYCHKPLYPTRSEERRIVEQTRHSHIHDDDISISISNRYDDDDIISNERYSGEGGDFGGGGSSGSWDDSDSSSSSSDSSCGSDD